MADIKKQLREFIDQRNREKADAENERKRRNDEDRTKVLEGVGGDLAKSLAPILPELTKAAQISEESLRRALAEGIQLNSPELDLSVMENAASRMESAAERIEATVAGMNLREPIVNIPAPVVNVTEREVPPFPSRIDVGLPDYDNLRPMPVMMMDTKGRPFQFPQGATGGKADFLTIKGFSQSAFSEITNPDGRVLVELPTGSSGLTDSELRATAVPVSQVSGANWSVSVTDIFGSTGTGFYNADNRVRVSLETGGSGLTDAELRASSVPVEQVSGSAWTTYVKEIFGSTATDIVNPDGRLKVELPTGASGLTDTELRASAVPVSQVSGSSWSTSASIVSVSDIFSTTATSTVVNPDNRVRVELPSTTITGVTNTIATANVDSTGVQYSGSNPIPTYLVAISGSGNSTISVGDLASGTADTGSAPVKVGGIARTANPTAEANGDRITFTADDLGRQITRPVQVRDLIVTAYVSVTNGTETTLLAASAGSFHDLVMLVGSNNSDAAVSVDIRAVTAGNIINTLRIPANGTAGFVPSVPWPQDATGNNWTVDGPDETGRTLTFSGLFSREV